MTTSADVASRAILTITMELIWALTESELLSRDVLADGLERSAGLLKGSTPDPKEAELAAQMVRGIADAIRRRERPALH